MLDAKRIKELFVLLNEELKKGGEKGEVGIVGGAVMCLVYNARAATKDVDAIFEPSALIRKLVKKIGDQEDVGADWLNDAVKGFLQSNFTRESVLDLSHLRVWAPDARYMLAMKCISARWDSHDRDDVVFLIKHLELKKSSDVIKLIENYYPSDKVLPKTRFFLEELFSKKKI